MISAEGIALGHAYDGSAVNSPCRKCGTDRYMETGRVVTVLTCDYDDDE